MKWRLCVRRSDGGDWYAALFTKHTCTRCSRISPTQGGLDQDLALASRRSFGPAPLKPGPNVETGSCHKQTKARRVGAQRCLSFVLRRVLYLRDLSRILRCVRDRRSRPMLQLHGIWVAGVTYSVTSSSNPSPLADSHTSIHRSGSHS